MVADGSLAPAPASPPREGSKLPLPSGGEGWGEGGNDAQEPTMTEKRNHTCPSILARARDLRQSQTPAEARLWARLRNRQLGGFKFRRQHPIDRFVVDFYCAAGLLVVEIDGDSHAEQIEYDQARTEWLSDQGYHVIRFTNRDVFGNLDAVLEAILDECNKLTPGTISPSPSPSPKGGEQTLSPPGGRGLG
jgi:very-short-patch-repair endonuclease